MSHNLRGQGIIVVGGQWGDEGKGRIVDTLAEECDITVRFQGGNNAGHSIHIGESLFILHLIPCGITRKNKIAVIGNGVVIDPVALMEELSLLQKRGIICTSQTLKIAKNAHIIFPFHKQKDIKREAKSEIQLGTTKRGIGPCYEDKVARFGILAQDLLSEQILVKKFRQAQLSSRIDDTFSLEELVSEGLNFGEKLAPFLCDVGQLLENSFKQNRRILFEGAQGTLLDIDHGTYPFVTSSNCVAAQASIGSGIGMNWFSEVLMVSKAYCTRVGNGPFFTELSNDEQEKFRVAGKEFGATTGRPRRCGWLDLEALKYAARLNGATGIVLTKIDVLAGMGKIMIGTSYSFKNQKNLTFQQALELYSMGEKITVNYMTLPPVEKMPLNPNRLQDLPESMRKLCEIIERELCLPIRMISFGPKRGQEFWCN